MKNVSIAQRITLTLAIALLSMIGVGGYALWGLGAAQSGYMMAAQTMILEFGSRAEMPMRIAISSTAEGIMASLGPLAGGFIADHYGFNVVFGASIGFLVLGLLILLTVVKEPRTARMASL